MKAVRKAVTSLKQPLPKPRPEAARAIRKGPLRLPGLPIDGPCRLLAIPEDRFQIIGRFLSDHNGVDLIVEKSAAVVKVRGADGGPDTIDHHRLRMQHRVLDL